MIDVVQAEQNKNTDNLEQSVSHLYMHVLILQWHLSNEKEDSG